VDEAKAEWIKLKEARSAEQLSKLREIQWYWNPKNMSLQDRKERAVSTADVAE